jgi:hypothetical protein
MKPMNKVVSDRFLDLCCRLSPENLCCDGEISGSQVTNRLAVIRREWRDLEKKVGYKVTEDEVWEQYFSNKSSL